MASLLKSPWCVPSRSSGKTVSSSLRGPGYSKVIDKPKWRIASLQDRMEKLEQVFTNTVSACLNADDYIERAGPR